MRKVQALIAALTLPFLLAVAPANADDSGDGLLLRVKAGIDETGTPFADGTCFSTIGVIDFNWGYDSVGGTCPEDQFTTYTSGSVISPGTGYLKFCLSSDDGARLEVAGQLLINSLGGRHPEDYPCNYESVGIAVTTGSSYPIALFHVEDGGGAVLVLKWAFSITDSDYPDYAVIPLQYLSSGTQTKSAPVTFGKIRDFSIAPQARNRTAVSGEFPGAGVPQRPESKSAAPQAGNHPKFMRDVETEAKPAAITPSADAPGHNREPSAPAALQSRRTSR